MPSNISFKFYVYITSSSNNVVMSVGDFEEAWSVREGGTRSKIGGALRPEKPLQDRVASAVRALNLQGSKLDVKGREFYHRRVSDFLKKYDGGRATIYADELAEIRRDLRVINQSKLAVEQISRRLSTVKDTGDIVVNLASATSIIKSVRRSLSHVLPHADKEFNTISNLLSNLLVDAAQVGGVTLNFSAANAEAEKILKEAEKQVEEEMIEKPSTIPSARKEEISS